VPGLNGKLLLSMQTASGSTDNVTKKALVKASLAAEVAGVYSGYAHGEAQINSIEHH
jgi:hypothetical protein